MIWRDTVDEDVLTGARTVAYRSSRTGRRKVEFFVGPDSQTKVDRRVADLVERGHDPTVKRWDPVARDWVAIDATDD